MRIEVPTPDGAAEAWLARPDDEGVYPGVLMFMDAFGVRPRIHEMADRIASWGYVVMAPNVFYRDGRADDLAPSGPLFSEESRAAFFTEVMPRIKALTPDLSARDTAAWLDALTTRDDVTEPVGVVGYCMGARLAVRAACDHPDRVAACGGFHGAGLAADTEDSPHRGLARARAEFVFGHADHDRSMTRDDIQRLGQALSAANLVATNEVYADAAHGYTMADTAVFDPAATERHFRELRALFDRVLRA